MNVNISEETIAQIQNYDQFQDMCVELQKLDDSSRFNLLFPLAIARSSASSVAAKLLVATEPKPQESCSQLLEKIARSSLDASNHEVPFYLIVQFGKSNLLNEYRQYCASTRLSDEEKRRVSIVAYWTAPPTEHLVLQLHQWEWQDEYIQPSLPPDRPATSG